MYSGKKSQLIFVCGSGDSYFLASLMAYENNMDVYDIVIWDKVISDPGSNFNPFVGMYTVPVHGFYQ